MPPVIIVGAARSGTNMLRDVLAALPGFGTWPCDEINYIWKHGNLSEPSDELSAGDARPEVRRYIRKAFRRIAERRGIERVVEKTCANSLRVPFVDAVVPEAFYIHIVRDGYAATASAMKRWTADLDLPYIVRKARYVPPGDLPFYAVRYLRDRLHRLRSGERRLAFWGPRFKGFREAAATCSLAELCALQWRRSVERATADLGRLPPERVVTVHYEDFVVDPERELARMCAFLDVPLVAVDLPAMTRHISAGGVGRGRNELDEVEMKRIQPIIDA